LKLTATLIFRIPNVFGFQIEKMGDFDTVCRLCLETEKDLTSIFNRNEEQPLSELIKLFTSVEIGEFFGENSFGLADEHRLSTRSRRLSFKEDLL
jgi:hypothetical protein